MPAISAIGLAELQSILQTTRAEVLIDGLPVQSVANVAITKFMKNPGKEENWDNMNIIIQKFMTEYKPLITGLRVLVTLTEGHVAYDTLQDASGRNTYANYLTNTINVNHNTRVSIMIALLSTNGVGNENKYSSTTGLPTGYNVVRMGLSPSDALGCTRVSATST
jgi:hypothetical protein